MKKVVLSLALVAMMSVSLVSCKDTAKEETVPAVEVAPEVAPVVEEIVPVEAASTTVEAPVKEEATK